MTNADKIRSMNNEELKEFINSIGDTCNEYLCNLMGKEVTNSCANPNIDVCCICVGEWLESKAD